MPPRLAVLISGRGSNLQAIVDAIGRGELHAEVGVVVSNRADAAGLERASRAGIETLLLDHLDKARFPTREAYDRELAREVASRRIALVCLAGFMRRLTPAFIDAFPAILNIHPSLLPAFPGMHAQHRAWEHGVKVTGVTVHLVTAELDAGPIVLQQPVELRDDDTAEALSERLLRVEHLLYPKAIQIVLSGRWRVEGRRFLQP